MMGCVAPATDRCFTHQAEIENAENLLVLHRRRELIAVYVANFHLHRDHARQTLPAYSCPTSRHDFTQHQLYEMKRGAPAPVIASFPRAAA